MSALHSFIEEAKSKRLYITATKGKFELDFSLLVAIILALILPQLTVIIVVCILAGWLQVEVQPATDTPTE